MDHFGGKRLSQLSPDEIRVLVDRKTAEDQQLDFKSKVWTDNEDGRFELLHDVTALANADGGYLLLGVGTRKDEAGRDLAAGFAPVAEAAREAQRIRDICFQHVDPRIQGLEVEPFTISTGQGDSDVVAVHVPPSSSRPHGFAWRDATVFVRRYGAHVRRMPISEIGELLSIRYFPETETSRRLTEVVDEVRALREEIVQLAAALGGAQADALAQTNVDRLLEMMEERFRRRYEDLEDEEAI
jgi:predicted HTH transcriptional regulator